jgi:hypothetical protein
MELKYEYLWSFALVGIYLVNVNLKENICETFITRMKLDFGGSV